MPDGIDKSLPCPFGRRLPVFDVTIPKDFKLFSVEGMCVVWGIIPFGVIGFGIVDTMICAFRLRGIGTRELTFLVFVGLMVGLNEVVFKGIAREPRPDKSCNFSCGFPSGHSTMSAGFFMLMFLDAAYRTVPRVPMSEESAQAFEDSKKQTKNKATFLGLTLREWIVGDLRAWATFMPLSAAHTLNQTDFAWYTFAWAFLLLPVPFSRLVLHDHSPKQVFAGATIGVAEATLFFVVIRHGLLPKLNYRLGKRIGRVLVHDFPLPMIEVLSSAYYLLARLDEKTLDARDPELLEKVGRVRDELDWYMQELDDLIEKSGKKRQKWFTFEEDVINARRERARLQRAKDKISHYLCGHASDSDSVSESSSVMC